MPRLFRRLINALLLPLAVVVVLLEDVVWAAVMAVLRGLRRLPALQALEVRLGRLSGYAALPLFLVPEILGRVGEVWAIALLAGGHATQAAAVYVLVRLVATLVAVFIYHACEAALLRIGWFARVIGWIHVARDWALGLLRPVGARMRAMLRRGRGRLALRWLAIRRWWRVRRT